MATALEQVLIDTLKKSTAVGGEIYDATKLALSKAIDFASEQIPDVIAQLLAYNIVHDILVISFWVILGLMLTIPVLIMRASSNTEGMTPKEANAEEESKTIFTAICWIYWAIALIICATYVDGAICKCSLTRVGVGCI